MANAWSEIQSFLRRYLSPAVFWILILNVGLFLMMALLSPFDVGRWLFLLMETPSLAVGRGFLWQFATYMFLHAGPGHLLFNMLILWFFAPRLEYRWGTTAFLWFYFIVGVGAGAFHAAVSFLTGHPDATILGASGALYGIMLAYAIYYPDDTVLLYFVLPIRIKYLMIILGIFTFISSMGSEGAGGISHVTHLGGLLVAALYLFGGRWRGGWPRRRGPRVMNSDPNRYRKFRY